MESIGQSNVFHSMDGQSNVFHSMDCGMTQIELPTCMESSNPLNGVMYSTLWTVDWVDSSLVTRPIFLHAHAHAEKYSLVTPAQFPGVQQNPAGTNQIAVFV